MRLSRVVASGTAFAIACLLAAGTVSAQGGNQGKGKKPDQPDAKAAPRTPVEIGSKDRDAITKYFETNTAGLPPGLARRGDDLPPGLEKQLQRNGQLPPGLQKKLEPLPAPLSGKLGKLPSGYNWFMLGPHVVAMDRQKNVIGDFLLNVVR
jgi:hypothetical protein